MTKKKTKAELMELLPEEMKELNLVVLMQFGSHLYGTETVDSDTDIKGIYMPTREQILLNNVPPSFSHKTKKGNEEKNGKEDVDIQIHSIYNFFKLAMKGETEALDMLHAPYHWPVIATDAWNEIVAYRNLFHTKCLKSFVFYARKQAAKYGIKGSRIAAAQEVLDYFSDIYEKYLSTEASALNILGTHLKNVWDQLPRGEHIDDTKVDPNGLRIYQVCGKQFQETCKLTYVEDALQNFVNKYGQRARDAAENKGVDWKAMSHALRAAVQVSELLSVGYIHYPLCFAGYLTQVKQGLVPFKEVQETLETWMRLVEDLTVKSQLPESVDVEAANKMLLDVIIKYAHWYDLYELQDIVCG